ncbi:hypothetical protein [Dokdonia sp. 4H-3-7-5]|uniref:hypothetical protein n=1 Tax=Dokdonia sp. (strain 4H-3-7-5) TaxID=983548 RepID=UPI00020A6F88|nr:hypothetical protein [Dokdonia sp. 4H-3-7-5]AEE20234.1 hypothetical protein Krodi_2256 [Dokdonia sp. 4H-3-7-5]
MRNIIFITIFLLSTICTAQNNDSIPESEKEYLELLNYTPKNFKIDLENKPSSEFLKTDLNSIWKLKFAYELKDKLNDNEIKWLEDQINQLAVAYFLEKKPIIIESVGGYSGCPEQLVTSELKNETKVTILNFCSGGCIVNNKTEDFIRIFNNRTEKLLLN